MWEIACGIVQVFLDEGFGTRHGHDGADGGQTGSVGTGEGVCVERGFPREFVRGCHVAVVKTETSEPNGVLIVGADWGKGRG